MKYLVIFLFTFLFSGISVNGQSTDGDYDAEGDAAEYGHVYVDPGEVSEKTGYAKERIDVQRFNKEKYKKIVGNQEFKEKQPASKPITQDGESSKGGKRVRDNSDNGSSSSSSSNGGTSPMNSSILTMIVYGLAIAIIVYILFLIIKTIRPHSSKRQPRDDLAVLATHIEDIKELEIDRLLREAITAGNYRLVIRIHFLGLLQRLNDDGFIVWRKNKTNRDYLTELFAKKIHFDEVKTLTLVYEEVWYGDHSLEMPAYEQIISAFKAIDQKLKTSSR